MFLHMRWIGSGKRFRCSNPGCGNVFLRRQSQVKLVKYLYCSRSCAVTVNNKRFPKRHKLWGTCVVCGKKCNSDQMYCSRKCRAQEQTMSKEDILEQIREFYQANGRIPLKREFEHYKAARGRFGTWNKAVKAAGFNPNPVIFAKKWTANDGHRCDSLAEKIIDDWLYARKIPHDVHVPYGVDRMTADFEVNGTLIEFLGLAGQLQSYDALIERKRRLWEQQKLNVIQVLPNDLFPENKLSQVLEHVL